jgi:hypothetical protein
MISRGIDNSYHKVCKCKHSSQNLRPLKRVKLKMKLMRDFFLSLFYNCHLSKSYLFDILLEPGASIKCCSYWVRYPSKLISQLFFRSLVCRHVCQIPRATLCCRCNNFEIYCHHDRLCYRTTLLHRTQSKDRYFTVSYSTIWLKSGF